MNQYSVSYTTPVAPGVANINAKGIFDAKAEAITAVHILTGHSIDAIQITAVRDAQGTTLWEPEP